MGNRENGLLGVGVLFILVAAAMYLLDFPGETRTITGGVIFLILGIALTVSSRKAQKS